jgi:hypothetical protein
MSFGRGKEARKSKAKRLCSVAAELNIYQFGIGADDTFLIRQFHSSLSDLRFTLGGGIIYLGRHNSLALHTHKPM